MKKIIVLAFALASVVAFAQDNTAPATTGGAMNNSAPAAAAPAPAEKAPAAKTTHKGKKKSHKKAAAGDDAMKAQ
jgi:hypothetical protein